MNLEDEIKYCAKLLKQGKVILYPTDTIWGVGCDATQPKAIDRIKKIKQRKTSKSMIVLLDDEKKLEKYVEHVPPIAYDLILNSKSPLTIVYEGGRKLAKNLISKDGTIAIRIVNDRFASPLIHQLGHPVVSTSANISGMLPPRAFNMISAELINRVDYVVKHSRYTTRTMKASTIIKIEKDGRFSVLRP